MLARHWRSLWRLALQLLVFFAVLEVCARGIFANSVLSRVLLVNPADVAWRLFWLNHQGDESDFIFSFDVYDETKGWSLKPGIRDLTVFGDRILNSNSRGVRGRAEFDFAKPPGTTRILVFGDSQTFGDFVSDDQTYAHHLHRLIPDSEVINLGVHGYADDQILVYLKEVAWRYQPDIVILGFTKLGMSSNLLTFRDYAKPRFELSNGRLRLTNVPVPDVATTRSQGADVLRSLDLLETLFLGVRYLSGLSHVEDLTSAILVEAAAEIRAIPAQPLFVYVAMVSEILNHQTSPTREEEFFVDVCEAADVDPLLLRPVFEEQLRRGAQFETDPLAHWGPAEHEVAAAAIHERLRDLRMLGHGASEVATATATPTAGAR